MRQMVKLLWALQLLFVVSQAADYDAEKSQITLKVGDKNVHELGVKLDFYSDDVLVFGEACKDAKSCTTQAHKPYVPKDNKGTSKGTQKFGTHFEGERFEGATVAIDNITSEHNLNVVKKKADGDPLDYPYDGALGFSLNNEDSSTFAKLVSKQDKGKQFLLLVPKNSKDSKSVGRAVIGEDDSKACKDISLTKTELSGSKPTWYLKTKVSVDGKDAGELVIRPAFENKHGLTQDLIDKHLSNASLTSAEYGKNDLKITFKYGGQDLTLDKSQFYVEKDKKYERDVEIIQKLLGADIALGNKALKNYCIKFAKEDKDYKIGLSERKNSVGMISAALGMMMMMLALVH